MKQLNQLKSRRNQSIIIIDDPLSETDTPENRRKFNKWLDKTISTRLKTYKGPAIILKSK